MTRRKTERRKLLEAARGDRPAERVFREGRVVNVLTGEVEEAAVAVEDGWIVGVGPDYRGTEEVDLAGKYLLPGFLDSHVHIESSLCLPYEFARAVVPRGTTTVISDPHEIANVHGLDGIRYMLDASEGIPLSVFVMASSCVPATPMGTSGATLEAEDLLAIEGHPRVLGLAELMNFPGAIHGDPGIWAKLEAFQGRVVDGHAPGVSGGDLNAYILAGPGSDHEATTAREATEKLRRGLFLFFRQATNARNLGDLLPALNPLNTRRVALCTDDRQPPDLLGEGGIDAMVRRVVSSGIDPVEAIRLATLNPAEYFGLSDRGAVAPGRRADLLVTSSLEDLDLEEVWVEGRRVASNGAPDAWPPPPQVSPPEPRMHLPPAPMELRMPAGSGPVRVIGTVPDQLVTEELHLLPTTRDGHVEADPERDLLKIAVVERHRGTGRIGLGLVSGMGLQRGAIAGTVAHDHHNLIMVGADDASMETAARAVAETGGGLVVAQGDRILARLPLPVGGLMGTDPVETTARKLEKVVGEARKLGSKPHDPFMALSFLGLEVIPALKITDQGLVDVNAFQPVDLWVEADAPEPL